MYTRWARAPPSAWPVPCWPPSLRPGQGAAGGVGGQPDVSGQASEGAAGVVGVDRRASLSAEHQVQLDTAGTPAQPRQSLRIDAASTPAGYLSWGQPNGVMPFSH